jgi:alkanesulfonate monooxygenase SsuD/methylene tetrahydromethanopterin reductase-like flavin-dependent oxidoreductase (luciferase family)
MEYGLFSMGEHPGRRPRDAYEEDLREIVRADELGWTEVWIGEHHLNGKVEVLPSPEMLIAKASNLTSHIRLGPGVRLLGLHYPLDVASDAATADHLTDGRYNFGFGTGAAQEFPFYGIDYDEAHARAEESIEIILRAWSSEEPFSWDGRFWQLRDVYLWPLPLQQPHMPVARACTSPDSYYSTGHRGFWALGSQFQPARTLVAGWAEYERGARDAGRAPTRADFHVCRLVWVDETDERARDTVRAFQDRSLAYLRSLATTARALAALKPSPEASLESVTFDYLCDLGQFVVGSPDTVIRRLRQLYDEVGGFGTLLLLAGRDPAPIEQRLTMYDRFAREVAPALADLGTFEVAAPGAR